MPNFSDGKEARNKHWLPFQDELIIIYGAESMMKKSAFYFLLIILIFGFALIGYKNSSTPSDTLPAIKKIHLKGEISAEEKPNIFGNLKLQKNRYSLFLPRKEGLPCAINVNLSFPQITDINMDRDYELVNLMCFDLATKFLLGDVSLSNINEVPLSAERRQDETPSITDQVAENDYEILYLNPPYLSLKYSGTNIAGGQRMSNLVYYATLNIETGKYIYITDVICKEDLIAKIQCNEYTVLHGQYLPGGWNGEEMADQFSAAFINHSSTTGKITSIYLEGRWIEINIYDVNNSEMFAICDDGYVIRIPFEDSLNGYVVLKIDR